MSDLSNIGMELSRAVLMQIECALKNAITTREGEREWSHEELALHGKRLIFPDGREEFQWKGVPILRVERGKDERHFGFVVTELQPNVSE